MALHRYDAVEQVSRELLRRGWYDGRQFSAGQHVHPMPDGYDWVVVTRQGIPVVLAHDVYGAAAFLVDLECGALSAEPGQPVEMPADSAEAARLFKDWWERRWRFGWP